MLENAATSGAVQETVAEYNANVEAIERRRLRNREHMRRLREAPGYREMERKRRELRKIQGHLPRAAAGEVVLYMKQEAPRRCAICRKRKAVETVTRLRPSTENRTGFVAMRIAYCGFC